MVPIWEGGLDSVNIKHVSTHQCAYSSLLLGDIPYIWSTFYETHVGFMAKQFMNLNSNSSK